MRFLDGLVTTLCAFLVLLLATGGARFDSPGLKFELSEIDAFAWALFALLGLRRILWKRWLPPRLERACASAFATLERNPRTALAWGCGIYVTLGFWNSRWRFDSFHANAFDLGFVDQALWSSAHGHFLRSTLARGNTYLGEHFSPILGAIGQVYRLTDSVSAVFLLQALVLASGAPLVYALGRRLKLSKGLSALAALCLLAYQPLRLANNFDFREDDLFVPIFLGALLALESARWPMFWGLIFLSWTVKESAPVFTVLIGVWLFLDGGRRRSHGAMLALLSAAAFLIINLKVTPLFVGTGAEGRTMLTRRLGRFGATNAEILRYALEHPFAFGAAAAEPVLQLKALRYVITVSAPFVRFAGAAPLPALIAAAGIVLNLMVNQPSIGFHYECVLIPFLFFVLLKGLSHRKGARHQTPTAQALLALSFLLFFGRSPVESIRRYMPDARDRLVAEELAKIPARASVATQSALFPHLDHRDDITLFSRQSPPADVIAVDLSPERDHYATPQLEADAASIDPRVYATSYDRDLLKIWVRKSP